MSDALEQAWKDHETREHTPVSSLAIEFAKVDKAKWVKLQQDSMAAGPEDRGAADRLAKYAGHIESRLVWELILARPYQIRGLHDEALSWAARAITVTPRWDPRAVAIVCNTVAWSLHLMGRAEDAVRWCERGLAADPGFGMILGTFCEASAKIDPARAAALHRFLEEAGYEASFWGDHRISKDLAKTPPYELTPEKFAARTEEDVLRLIVAQRFDTNLDDASRHLHHSVALVGLRRFEPALLAASIAAATGKGEVAHEARSIVTMLQRVLPAETAARVLSKKKEYAHNPEARAKAVAALVKAKDTGALEDLVLDARYGVSMAAVKGLSQLGAAKRLVPYLEMARDLEYKTSQSIFYDGFPKPFDILGAASTDKPEEHGEALIERVIAHVPKNDEGVSIPVPQPVPKAALDALAFAPGIPLSPSIKRWLAFDGGWAERELGWFDDPENPVFSPLPIHAIVHQHLAEELAAAFVKLPGKLEGALALPLDIGSESMRLLVLVPDDRGEYPVMYVDVDDTPMIGMEAPSFDIWIACRTGLVRGMGDVYKAEIAAAAKRFFKKQTYAYLDYPSEEEVERYEARLQKDLTKAEAQKPAAKKDAGKKAKAIEVPKLPEAKLGEALAQAIESDKEDRAQAFFAAAKERYPKGKAWPAAALIQATRHDRIGWVRELLAIGADPNVKWWKDPLLCYAAEHADIEVVRALLDAGADPNGKGEDGETPLHQACEGKRPDNARLLLDRGADPNAVDKNGRTPLIEAAHVFADNPPALFPVTVELAAMLIDRGADPSHGQKKHTPLHEAIEQHNDALVDLLLDRGADPNALDWQNENALACAFRHRSMHAFDRLRATNARRDVKNKEGYRLDDVMQGDGLLPAVFDVKLLCTAEPQKVRVKMKLLGREHSMHPFMIEKIALALPRLAEAGFAGSDVFAPSAGRGAYKGSTPWKSDKKNGRGEIESAIVSFEGTYTLAGVAPAALAMWLRGLMTQVICRPMALEIVGERPLDGSALAVDTARAASWLRDQAADPVKAWPTAKVKIADVWHKEEIGRVQLAGKSKGGIEAFAEALEAAMTSLLPSGVSDLRDTVAIARLGRPLLMGARAEGAWQAFPYMAVTFGGGSKMPIDPAAARVLFVNGIERLAEDASIAAVEWSYGVTRANAPPREGIDDELADQDQIEVSPSGRATCKTCNKAIDKGVLRFVEATLMGKRYHHLDCAARKLPARLDGAMKRHDGDIPDRAALEEKIAAVSARRAGKGKTQAAPAAAAPAAAAPAAAAPQASGGFPFAEIAKTGRSSCLKCSQAIAKDTARIAVARTVETPQGNLVKPGYLHPACAKGWEGVSAKALRDNTAALDDAQWREIEAALG